jgi:hypothetical protein
MRAGELTTRTAIAAETFPSHSRNLGSLQASSHESEAQSLQDKDLSPSARWRTGYALEQQRCSAMFQQSAHRRRDQIDPRRWKLSIEHM